MNPSATSRGYLIDLDGVIYRGNQPLPGAREFLDRLLSRGTPFLFLTNNSCFTPRQFQEKLAALGIAVPLNRFYSSAQATATWLVEQGAQRVFAIGEEGLFTALAEKDIANRESDVTHVVVGLDRAVNYDKLKMAARLIMGGARFVGTNSDPTIPVENGFDPGCGSLLAALEAATGKTAFIIGKPQPVIFQQAATRMKISLDQLTMIGDRLDTDIAGADAAGIHSVLVLTGHTTRKVLAGSTISPGEVWEDLRQEESRQFTLPQASRSKTQNTVQRQD